MTQYRVFGLLANVACVGIVGAAALGIIGPHASVVFAQGVPLSLSSVISGVAVDEPGSLALLASGVTAACYLVTRARLRHRRG